MFTDVANEDADPRVTCSTCTHAHGERCAAHPKSGLRSGYIGGITDLPQRCTVWHPRAAGKHAQQQHAETDDPRDRLRRLAAELAGKGGRHG